MNTGPVLLTLCVIFVVSRVIKLYNGLKAVNFLPGLRIPFQPLGFPGASFPTSWWNPGLSFAWVERFRVYRKFHSENVSMVPFVFGVPGIYTSNLEVARQVVAGGLKSSWIKPESASQALLLWGMNLVASDGEMWRKHRRIMGPAFNNTLYTLVWNQTLQIYRQMISSESYGDKEFFDVPVVQTLTFKLALLVIGCCGFGFPFTWSDPATSTDGTMSIQEALRIVTETSIFAVFAPRWVKNLPIPWIRQSRIAHEQLAGFMRDQAKERKAEIRGHTTGQESRVGRDVFSMLVQANETESRKLQLDDQELIGNVFVLLFAGHETTAHTLAATLGFLSYYENIQNEVVEQIISVVGYDRDPEIDDYAKLDKVLSVFYEAIRMFPSGYVLIREAAEDTVLTIQKPVGEEGSKTIAVPKGLQVVVDMIGIQYNPRYFEEPEKYKPSRWYGQSEAFTAFSVGPRECLGRRFASTEAVCFLTALLRDWMVVPILREGETKEEWKNRVLDGKVVFTLGVKDIPLRFTRRRRTVREDRY